jgi:hypothetical protein
MDKRHTRICLQCLGQFGFRLIEPFLMCEGQGQQRARVSIVRVEGNRLPELGLGLSKSRLLEKEQAALGI